MGFATVVLGIAVWPVAPVAADVPADPRGEPLTAFRADAELDGQDPTTGGSVVFDRADEATDALATAPDGTLEACVDGAGPDGGPIQIEVCAQQRPVAEAAVAAATSSDPFADKDDTWTPLCTGTGKDGYRVQPILAYDWNLGAPAPVEIDEVRHAAANADLTFSESAAKTGGQRRVRWMTSSGSGGCQVDVRTAGITWGLASFEDLVDELLWDGVISEDPPGQEVKYLIWTEGDLVPGEPGACGVGLRVTDDAAGAFDNDNGLSAPAAIKQPCWDIDGGGSVPAHELMHTLGAVQASAPHYNGAGHCTDDYDNMCYPPGGGDYAPVVDCTDRLFHEARFDCNNDDYFHTAPAQGSYLCRAWNTARSPFLEGYATGMAALTAPTASAKGRKGGIDISWASGPGCPGPSAIGLDIPGLGTGVYAAGSRTVAVAAPPGTYRVEVAAIRDGVFRSVFRNVTVPASAPPAPPNQPPRGGIVLSATDGRGYGMLAWAVDPETGGPTRMRVTIPGVISREYDWNYAWADMFRYTGVNRTESLVFLAQLPPGTHQVCFDAQDPQSGGWTNLGCRTHTVK